MWQEAGPEDRRDLEPRPAVDPGVVVGDVADQVDDVALAGDQVADQPDPAHPAAEADQDGGDGGDPTAPRQLDGEGPRHEGEDAGEQGARQEVDPDDVDAGDGRGDRAVEIGEPVVGQRLAGEVGDLRREVAGRDARPDRDVDEEVAPVPAAADPAVGRLVPAVAHQDDEHDRADREGQVPGQAVVQDRLDEPDSGRAAQRRQPAMAKTRDDQGRDGEEDRADDDRLAPEPADPGDDVDEMSRGVGAGHDGRADRARVGQSAGRPCG